MWWGWEKLEAAKNPKEIVKENAQNTTEAIKKNPSPTDGAKGVELVNAAKKKETWKIDLNYGTMLVPWFKLISHITWSEAEKEEVDSMDISKIKEALDDKLNDSNNPIYKEITQWLINQLYKNKPNDLNDKWLIKALSEITLDPKNKEQIKNYIVSQTSADKIKNIYEWKFSSIVFPTSIDWPLKDIRAKLEEKEIDYKREELNTSMKKTVDAQLSKYGFDEEVKKEIQVSLYEKIDAKTKSYDKDNVKVNYTKKDTEKAVFKKDIISVLNEQVAEQNKGYLLAQFDNIKFITYFDKTEKKEKMIDINQDEKDHFQAMLNKSNSEDINALALATAYPDQSPKILTEIRKKVKEKGEDKNSVAFKNAKISYATTDEAIKKMEENKDVGYKYTTQLEATKVTRSIENSKKIIADTLDVYLKNNNIQSIHIDIPKWNDAIRVQTENIIKTIKTIKTNNPNGIAITLNQKENINAVKITSKETVESPDHIKLDLKALNANIIWDRAKINQVLLDSDPRMKDILNLDSEYKIIGGEVYWSASRNITHYNNESPFILWNNVTKIAPASDANNDPNNDNVTNNPDLAYNRAASFIDYFMHIDATADPTAKKKVDPTAKFDLKYEVNGPNRSQLKTDLKNKNWKEPNEDQLVEAFKEWQFATIDLKLTKTETKINEKEIPIENNELASWFSVNIIWTASKTSHIPWWPWWPSRDWGIKGLNIIKKIHNPIACPIF